MKLKELLRVLSPHQKVEVRGIGWWKSDALLKYGHDILNAKIVSVIVDHYTTGATVISIVVKNKKEE